MNNRFFLAFLAFSLIASLFLSGCLETLFPYGLPGQNNPTPNSLSSEPPASAAVQPPALENDSASSSAPMPPPAQSTVNATDLSNATTQANATIGNSSNSSNATAQPNNSSESQSGNLSAKFVNQSSIPKAPRLNESDYPLEIVYFNVGFGDSTLVRRGNLSVLIDAGNSDSGVALGNSLSQLGVKRLEMLALSNWDEGNVGGISQVAKKAAIQKICQNGAPTKTNVSVSAQEAIKKFRIPYVYPQAGDKYSFGDVEFRFYNPQATRAYANDNLNSLVFSVHRNGFCAFFPGMLDQEAEPAVLARMGNLSECQVFKLPNRGVGRPTPSLLIDRLNPKEFVLSVGSNEYGLPSPSTLERIRLRGTPIYRTSSSGNIYLRAYPNDTYSFETNADLAAIGSDYAKGFLD